MTRPMPVIKAPIIANEVQRRYRRNLLLRRLCLFLWGPGC